MPRTDVYRSLLFLIGIYSNLLDPLNEREIIFSFSNSLPYSLFVKMHMVRPKSAEGVCFAVDLNGKCSIGKRRRDQNYEILTREFLPSRFFDVTLSNGSSAEMQPSPIRSI